MMLWSPVPPGVYRSLERRQVMDKSGIRVFPISRFTVFSVFPTGDRGVQVALADQRVVEWQPGDKQAWHPLPDSTMVDETRLRLALSLTRGDTVASVAMAE